LIYFSESKGKKLSNQYCDGRRLLQISRSQDHIDPLFARLPSQLCRFKNKESFINLHPRSMPASDVGNVSSKPVVCTPLCEKPERTRHRYGWRETVAL